ncbi:MAG: hypothetical protein ABIY55_00290 [Kofleriaceae bacterium]
MTIDKSDQLTQLTPGGPPVAQTLQKITIKVNSNGTFEHSSYNTDQGAECACVPAYGSTFTGYVEIWYDSKLVTSWAVNPANTYTMPAPPELPSCTCVLASHPTGGSTNSNGTIHIGTSPPFAPPTQPKAAKID